jgi:succinate-semialdehyde dehydrogenase/glutarate-semialdehyde dehydrogenase
MSDEAVTPCINPATGEELGHVPLHRPEHVRAAVARASEAQRIWAGVPVKRRAAVLKAMRDHLADRADELAEIISRDNGKTRTDALATEVLPAIMALDYYCRKAPSFLKDRRLMPAAWIMGNKTAKNIRVPYGVVGIISPWNYPFGIPFSEVVMALLAGNAVILKVASQTQLVGGALEACFNRLDLPPGLFSHINLPGRAAGTALLESGVNKLFFTGSVSVGRTLMAQAANSLTPVVLELGGNDPMLVCEDADLERAASGAVWAGLQNSGQSCGGVERIYVQRSVYPDFLDLVADKVRRLRVGFDRDYHLDMGSMTTAKQKAAVEEQVRQALEAGAHMHAQSKVPDEPQGLFLPAMLLTQVDHTMSIMREETFGPVLCVMPVEHMQEALALANDSDLGLTASVWTRNRREGGRLARRIRAGVVMVNDHLMAHGLAQVPWGGFKQSGIGRSHGAVGMDEMTQVQCIVNDLMPGVRRNLWWHPHGPEIYDGLRGLIDYLYGRRLLRRLGGISKTIRILPRAFKKQK